MFIVVYYYFLSINKVSIWMRCYLLHLYNIVNQLLLPLSAPIKDEWANDWDTNGWIFVSYFCNLDALDTSISFSVSVDNLSREHNLTME